MSKAATPKKLSRNRYSPAFKQEALALADRVGAAEAARQLGLQAAQLYAWRSKAHTAFLRQAHTPKPPQGGCGAGQVT